VLWWQDSLGARSDFIGKLKQLIPWAIYFQKKKKSLRRPRCDSRAPLAALERATDGVNLDGDPDEEHADNNGHENPGNARQNDRPYYHRARDATQDVCAPAEDGHPRQGTEGQTHQKMKRRAEGTEAVENCRALAVESLHHHCFGIGGDSGVRLGFYS
jgi:hypothetical protein